MLIEDRAVDVLFSPLDPVDPDTRDMDRFLAMVSEFFFVWLGDLEGIVGAPSPEAALCREAALK
jgi:hypothetical protein